MSQTIKLKRSAVAGKVPTTGSLQLGELAVNTYDGKAYLKKDDGIESVQSFVITDSTTTGSVTLIGDLTTTGSVNVSGSLSINNYTLPLTDGTSNQIMFTDGLGNIEFDFLRDVYVEVKNVSLSTLPKGTPVHVTGSVGNTNLVIPASASNATTMPATFVLNEQLAPDQEGLGIAIGFINGVNTSTFTEGDVVYVGENGGYTNIRPTGSNLVQNLGIVTKVDVNNGSGYVLGAGRTNAVPNLLNGEIFFGEGNTAVQRSLATILSSSYYSYSGSFVGTFNGNGLISSASYVDYQNIDNKPTLVSGSSQVDVTQTTNYNQVVNISGSQTIYGIKTFVGDNIFNGTQTFNNITVEGSASIAYLQSVTGSAKIIGDAFIVLNNNIPAQPKAGIRVIDSGSTGVTSSFFWDGDTDDWKYEYNVGEDHEGAVALFGPEGTGSANTFPYPTVNYILKSDGKHHLYDSQIKDDGTSVHIANNLIVTGSITAGTINATVEGIAATASYVEYVDIANKPTLISGSSQIASDISGSFTSLSASIASDITELVQDSGSFSSRITILEDFSSSLDATFATDSELNTVSASLAGDISSNTGRLDTLESKTLVSSSAQIAGDISGSFNSISSSIASDISVIESDINSLQIDSGSFSTRVTSLEDFSSSLDLTYATDSELSAVSSSLAASISSNDSRLDTLEGKTLISGSAQIASEISGAFFDTSQSLSSRITTLEEFSSSLDNTFATDSELANVSSSLSSDIDDLVADSGSFSSRITNLEGFSSSLSTTSLTLSGSFSGSFEGDGSNITGVVSSSYAQSASTAITASYALNAGSGAGFPYSGSAVITGSLLVTERITAQEFYTEFVSSSIIFESGSTKFGDSSDDKHEFTGSLEVDGNVRANSFEGIFVGALSSSAQIAADISGSFNSLSSSIAGDIEDIIDGTTTVSSASYAVTASYALFAGTGTGFPFSGSAVITGSLTVSGSVVDFSQATVISGSTFSGSFVGDASGLTNIPFVTGVTSYEYFSTPAVSWSFEHGLGSRFVNVQVFDENYNQLIPDSVVLDSPSSSLATFATASTGYMVATIGGEPLSLGIEFSQSFSGRVLALEQFSSSYAYTTGSYTGSFTGSFYTQDHFLPSQTDVYSLGSPTARFKDLYLSGSTIYLGELKLSQEGAGESGSLSIIGQDNSPRSLSVSKLEVGHGVNKVKMEVSNGRLTTMAADSNEIVKIDTNTLPDNLISSSIQITSLPSVDTGDLAEGSNLYYTDTRVKTKLNTEGVISGSVQVSHDSTTGFVANEHIDHSQVSITAGSGLTGGGDITTSRTLNIGEGTGITVSADSISTNDSEIIHDNLSGFVANEHIDHSGVTLTAGNGLTGGGDITTNRSFAVGQGDGISVGSDSVAVDSTVVRTSGTQTVGGDKTFSNNITIQGNLQVTGTTTTVNSTTVSIADNIIEVNGTGAANGGILVKDVTSPGTVSGSLLWDGTGNYWKAGTLGSENRVLTTADEGSGNGLDADTLDGQEGSYYRNASNINAGTIGDAYLPGTISSDITGNSATATKLATARTIGGVSFDGSANINLPGVNTAGNQNTSGNAATATKWATARTITLGGDLSGNVSIDGSANVTLTAAVADDSHTHDGRYFTETESDARFLGISAKAADSNLLDGLDSSQFLRSDANDTYTGTLTGPYLRLTSEIDASVSSTAHALQIGPTNSTNIIMDINEIMARNNGAVSTLNLNPDGGSVTIHSNTSAGTVTIGGNAVLHAGNYNSYSPTLTGTGASGTWGISITGDADTVDSIQGVNILNKQSTTYYNLDTWLQSTGTHGFYSPSSGAGTHFYPGDLGDYGSFRTTGRKNGWGGYSIEGRVVFMHNGSSNYGLYDDVNNQWNFYATLGGASDIRYAGTAQLSAENGYGLAANQMRSPIFYDSNNTGYYVDPASTSNIYRLHANDKYHYFGGSSNWDAVGFSNLTNVHFQGHNQFWVGAGNGTWFTGTANSKTQASGLAADASYAHDLLVTTMYSDVNYDRGITFAVESTGAGNSGWRLGKWHSGDARDSSKFVVDGQIFAKAGYTDEYDYYGDDYSTYYSSQGGNAHWSGDTGAGWHVPALVASSAIQIQSGNASTANSRKPQIQFHQYGYGGPGIEFDGPNKTMTFGELGTSNADRVNTFNFRFDNANIVTINADYLYHNSDIRSPIFYDSNNTGYYVDPASTSYVNVLGAAGRIYTGYDSGETNSFSCSNWFRSNGGTGWYNASYGGGIYMVDSTWVRVYNNKQFYSQNFIQSDSSVRAPIFYDSANTGYYLDPAATGTSLNAAGFIQGSNINTSIRHLGTAVSYDNDRTQKVSTGIAIYGAYSGGANSPWSYDLSMQVNGSGRAFEISADWISSSSTGLKVRSLRDCCQNWTPWTDIATSGRSFTNSVDLRAPIFYDSNDTGYYVDPASTSVINTLDVKGEIYLDGWFRNDTAGYGLYNTATTQHFYSDDDDWWNVAGGTAANGIRFRDESSGTIRGAIYANSSNDVGLLDSDLNWAIKHVRDSRTEFYINNTEYAEINTDFLTHTSDIRTPIFYDSNDTAVRWDAGTFVLRSTAPTIYFRDTDNRSAMIHVNSNLFYVLRGSGTDSETWTQYNSNWPLIINLENNSAAFGGTISAVGDITGNTSDERLKIIGNKIESPIEKLNQIEGFYYHYNELAKEKGLEDENRRVGVSAQKVQEILPEAVASAPFDIDEHGTSISGENYLTVKYERLVPLLIEGIKELSKQNQELQTEINQIKQLINKH